MWPSWVLCLQFPELKRLLNQGLICRLLLISSPLRSSRYLQLDASAGATALPAGCGLLPWQPGSRAGEELSAFELRSRFQPLRDYTFAKKLPQAGGVRSFPHSIVGEPALVRA